MKKINDKQIITILVVIIVIMFVIICWLVIRGKNNIQEQENNEIYSFKTNEKGIIEEPETPTRDGYIFKGWYIGDEKVDFSKEIPKGSEIKAKWEKMQDNELVKDNISIEKEDDIVQAKVDSEDIEKEVIKKEENINNNKPQTIDDSKRYEDNEKYNEKIEKTEQDEKTGLFIEWAKIEGSSIEQYRIYIKDKDGSYINGTLEITTIAGNTFEEKVTQNGSENIYIKSVIESIKIK